MSPLKRGPARTALSLAGFTAAGAVVSIALGQVLGAFAPRCTFACDPVIAGTLGVVAGSIAFAGFQFGPRFGEPGDD